MKFRILSHRADVWIEAGGKTLEELFENAVLGLAKVQKSSFQKLMSETQKSKKAKIKISSRDNNALIVDFLNEVLAKNLINQAIYKVESLKHKVSKTGVILEAKLSGFSVDRFDEDVKAVTYHDVEIKKIKSEFKVRLLLDI